MTKFAENQLEFHRPKYYSLSRETYKNIMKCYEQSRQTNEETEKCAEKQRRSMIAMQEELTGKLMRNCSKLERCTDTCKDELDMKCINKCGNVYMKETIDDYDAVLQKYYTHTIQ